MSLHILHSPPGYKTQCEQDESFSLLGQGWLPHPELVLAETLSSANLLPLLGLVSRGERSCWRMFQSNCSSIKLLRQTDGKLIILFRGL